MTVNEFILQLQAIPTGLKELPIVIISPNGLEMEPEVKIYRAENEKSTAPVKKMVVTFDGFA